MHWHLSDDPLRAASDAVGSRISSAFDVEIKTNNVKAFNNGK